MTSPHRFVALPLDESFLIAWPTPNHALFTAPEQFFADTRANPDYGKPGFTRDCGRRFHRGVDIAPLRVTPTGQTTRVSFTDCATGRDYDSDEPTWIPHDDIFCVYEGTVIEVVNDEMASDFGKHIVVEHLWPRGQAKFYTLYAHLSEIWITNQESLTTAQRLARMGQTSRSVDARNWMAIAPHLHFEVKNPNGKPYDPVQFLQKFLPQS